jgi:A/G-specific adenine glycosylase
MLQQTQVARVVEAFPRFLRAFPNIKALASSDTRDLLQCWQGMGYNRRALNLRATAQLIISDHNGRLPREPEVLRALPGIGKYTSNSIPVFAFNQAYPVIETNIRAVMTHFFCKGIQEVSEDLIERLVVSTLDVEQPRDWYNALMDLGSEIKRHDPNINKRTTSYKKQPQFQGSKRQVRGQVLKLVANAERLKLSELEQRLSNFTPHYSIKEIANDLVAEGFMSYTRGAYHVGVQR